MCSILDQDYTEMDLEDSTLTVDFDFLRPIQYFSSERVGPTVRGKFSSREEDVLSAHISDLVLQLQVSRNCSCETESLSEVSKHKHLIKLPESGSRVN